MKEFDLLDHIRGKSDGNTVVWLFNIGIERYWGQDISTVKSVNDEIIVNHMEEMNLLLARKQDYLILRKQPDTRFLEMLQKRGFEIPQILTPMYEDESAGIAEIVLRDPQLLEKLKSIGKPQKTYFVPYGVSDVEEKIAAQTELEMIGGCNRLSQQINNKIFARKISAELGFSIAEGQVCDSLDEVASVSSELLEKYRKVVIKYPTGASGKGLWVVDDDRKRNTTLKILERVCNRKKIPEEFVVERWYEKDCDLNYQIYVGKDGTVNVFSIKEQLLNETVYIGSLIRPRLSEEVIAKCMDCGKRIGELLYQHGYNGVLGVDAMVTKDGEFIPIIEVNARFTLSTYVSFMAEYAKGQQMLAFYHKVLLEEKDDFETIRQRLREEMEEEHFLCYVSETVKQETVGDYGRVFVLLMQKDTESVLALYEKAISCLERMGKS